MKELSMKAKIKLWWIDLLTWWEKFRKPKPMEFPIVHDRCPACRSRRKVADEAVKEEIAKGRMKVGTQAAFAQMVVPIMDPQTVVLAGVIVPVIIAYYDICECGNFYAFKITRQEQHTVIRAGGPSGPPPPLFPG